MADIYLEEIEAIIVAGTTEAGDGTSFPIFLGHMPDSTTAGVPDRSVAVLASIGFPDYGRVEIEEPGLQVLVRGASITEVSTAYEEAASAAHSIKNALHGYTGKPVAEGKHYVGIWNQSGPFFIGHDESMRPVFSTNLRILRSRTT
jgi:hypothetical protein